MKGRVNTRRDAPRGYVAIDKNLARELYNKQIEIAVCGNNVNAFHVFGGWHLGYTPSAECMIESTFDDMLNNFLFYLDAELGRYPVFYTKRENIKEETQDEA
jgi:hypothetical protein